MKSPGRAQGRCTRLLRAASAWPAPAGVCGGCWSKYGDVNLNMCVLLPQDILCWEGVADESSKLVVDPSSNAIQFVAYVAGTDSHVVVGFAKRGSASRNLDCGDTPLMLGRLDP